MEHEPHPEAIDINGELFDVVKQERLLPGMVLKSQARDAYARLGPKESALEEQIHTVSLHERGFPVARVLDSGEYGEDQWYFIEEALGNLTFSEQFKQEYQQLGYVSDTTHEKYLAVLHNYLQAQYNPANATSVSIEDFIESAIPDSTILANYSQLGGNVERYKQAIAKAEAELHDYPMGVLQFDLNPFNMLDGGVIDFELVGYGPLGYDVLLCSKWHRWFTSDQTSKYHLNYLLSPEQIAASEALVVEIAKQRGLPNPLKHLEAFTFIKTTWGFSSDKTLDEEPASKRDFYKYRAGLLTHCVESYLHDQPIDVLAFPEFRV